MEATGRQEARRVHDRPVILLDASLERLRQIEAVFDEFNVGVAALHLRAAVAALKSRVRHASTGEKPI